MLGAHLDEVNSVAGTRFAVWAPNATEVSVLCDQNHWTPGRNLLRGSDSGIWSGFVADVGQAKLPITDTAANAINIHCLESNN